MDFFRDLDLEKCAAIHKIISNEILKDSAMSGLYYELTPEALSILLNTGTLNYYKECVNGYLNAFFGLEDEFFKSIYNTSHKVENVEISEDSDGRHRINVYTGINANKRGYRELARLSWCYSSRGNTSSTMDVEMDSEEDIVKTTAESCRVCGASKECSCANRPYPFQLAETLILYARELFGDDFSYSCQDENMWKCITGLMKTYRLGCFYNYGTENEPYFETLQIAISHDRRWTELCIGNKRSLVNFYHWLYFFHLPPLLMSGELLTAYARIEFLRIFLYGDDPSVCGVQLENIMRPHRSMLPLILECLELFYPEHYAIFMYYSNNYPRFPLYSMAAKDFERCEKKHQLLVRTIANYLQKDLVKTFAFLKV